MNSQRAQHPFHVLIKPIGPICNLDCEYCFYLEKESLFEDKHSFRMSHATLERLTRQYIDAQPLGVREVNFAWQGGEPTLMGIEFFQQAMDLQHQFKREGMQITNSIQTNGTLLDDAWGEFFKAHDFLVGISIDGPENLHDHYRKTKKGQGSFQQVKAGLNILQKHGVEYNVLCVVNRVNAEYPLEVYTALKGMGAEHIQFIPIVEHDFFSTSQNPAVNTDTRAGDDATRKAQPGQLIPMLDTAANSPRLMPTQVSERSVLPQQYGEFLVSIFDAWREQNMGKVFVQQFETLVTTLAGKGPSICVHAPVCGRSLILEHDGGVYSCDHFVQPEFLVGNIHQQTLAQLVESPQQTTFGRDKLSTLDDACNNCQYLQLCYGGCPAHRITVSDNGNNSASHNYLCQGYKRFFGHAAMPLIKLISH